MGKTKEYPETTMWGILPAQGFWLNHAEDITLRNITVESAAPDSRPVYVTDDCRNITIE